jgi:hypothetical protein
MPFFLSFFLFLNGGVWAVWAVLERDVFVGVSASKFFIELDSEKYNMMLLIRTNVLLQCTDPEWNRFRPWSCTARCVHDL